MISSTMKIFYVLKSIVLLENINFLNSNLNIYKYDFIISIIFLSSAFSFFFFVSTTFAESSNSSSLMINSTDIDALFNHAKNLYDQQKYDEALEYYDKVLLIMPTNVDVLNNKALVLQALKRYDEALEYFDKALAIDQ